MNNIVDIVAMMTFTG